MKIHQLVSRLRSGAITLPEFQRGYIWKPVDVATLMDSLYREFPIGGITVWDTMPGDGAQKQLIVDGQQRLGSIYTCYTNMIPEMHQTADKKPPIDLYFNVHNGDFKFTSARERSNEPMWIRVSNILSGGKDEDLQWRQQIQSSTNYDSTQQLEYEHRISKLRTIRDRDIAVEEIDSSRILNEVQDMFTRINKQGKKPTRGDLEMARLCVVWEDAKPKIAAERQKWGTTFLRKALDTDAIIRNMTAVHTKRYQRTGLSPDTATAMQTVFDSVVESHKIIFNSLVQRLAIHEQNAVGGVQPFAVLAKYLSQNGGKFASTADEAKAIGYYLTSTTLGVYHGSTDTQIDRDLVALDKPNIWEELLNNATLKIGNAHFDAARLRIGRDGRSRAYGIIHVLQKAAPMRDWLTKDPIRGYKPDELEKHHIFPVYHLQVAKFSQSEIDDVANMALISAETNGKLTNSPPEAYLPDIDTGDQQMLNQHYIPRDRNLWKIENYHGFLEARRQAIAEGANDLLDKLRNGNFN